MNTQRFVIRVCWLLGVGIAFVGGSPAFAQGSAQPRMLSVWDTGKASADPLAANALAQKDGWKQVASGETKTAFQSDIVVSNGRLLAVARKQGTGVELYSLGMGKPVFRSRLLLAPSTNLERITLTENGTAAVSLEVASKS